MARLVVAATVTVLAALGTAAPAGSEARPGPRRTYIVELATSPLSVSDGSIRALEAGRIRRYEALVDRSERRALVSARARRAPVLHRYRSSFAGFAARLTADQAARLASAAGVAAVTPETVYRPLAEPATPASADALLGHETPGFLGLPAGIWARSGGPAHAGEGVTIGVIDSGIHPEHPSFAETPDGPDGARRYDGPPYTAPAGWKGTCQTGADFPASACNHKLIGARYFVDGFKARNVGGGERLSPRDVIGHGTHVAAIAAGNYGVKPVVGGHDLGIPAVSGIAPRARIAVYKICWTGVAPDGDAPNGTCMASDAVAAIDAAVADGVDVINYSVGSTSASFFGPVERAFLGAAAAGVFVANAAGNYGPDAGTLGSPNGVPWVTSVAATTLGRTFESPFIVTPGRRPGRSPAGASQAVAGSGASLAGSLRQAELVDAATAAARGVRRDRAALCLPGSLSARSVAGKAVVCRRGHTSRLQKSKVVHDAGGVALVLVNTKPDQETAADLHWVPTVHVSARHGAAIAALLADGGPATLWLGGGHAVVDPADRVAAFSSRGPASAVPDIAKPDLAAPGVNILAADAPARMVGDRPDAMFEIRTGTSMAAPEVAGAAALLIQLEPEWSPAAIKSALMTSAEPAVLAEDGRHRAGPLDVGSGRIEPNRAATTGLVLNLPVADYLRYLKGQVPEKVRDRNVTPIEPVDLNLPSVAFSRFGRSASTVRAFTSVDRFPQRWAVTVEGPPGVVGRSTPDRFEILPGATQAVTLSLRLAGAAPGVWTSGALVLVNETDGRRVRLPVSIQPVPPG
ncbi:MAG TPA: S8 family serine peptidase [Acidimicrobiia bacterium]|nr:S8 family serine peptidase [Acidimicrobiia bacterium]